MGQEPNIPVTNGDAPDDQSGYKGVEDNQDSEKGNQPADKNESGEENTDEGGESPQITKEQYDQLVEGWREDRDRYQKEIKDLRQQAKSPDLTPDQKKELEGLDEEEKVKKLVKIQRDKEEQLNKAEIESVKSEIRFYERTNPEFSKNKKSIIKVAKDYDCNNLNQAILIWKGLAGKKQTLDNKYHDDRKKNADGGAGGKGGGKVEVKSYNPKTDRKKSIGDLFREGGVN
jgi:hypothetical protein